MSSDLIDLGSNTKILSQLEKQDIIYFGSRQIPENYYFVFDIDKELSIPALVVEIWGFDGGYDHEFHRFLENDMNVNKSVPYFKPVEREAEVIKIVNYRSDPPDHLSEKEIFHFNMVPDQLSVDKTNDFNYPYELIIDTEGTKIQVVLPQWTPLQNIPTDRVKVGTRLLVWTVKDITTVMKVLKL
jgi:hypothetical protein